MIEIRRLESILVEPLSNLLSELESTGAGSFFYPHPLTREAVEQILDGVKDDLYYVVLDGAEAIGYGMLRGWDEGYEVPSLGIAISAKARGSGLAELLMLFLHYVAREHGASEVRLTVSKENQAALRLFQRLGYRFEPFPGNEGPHRLVGFKEFK